MTGQPRDESAAAREAAEIHAVLLQRFEHLDRPHEPLRTRDLTLREVRDSLWLANKLRPPTTSPAQPPPPDQQEPQRPQPKPEPDLPDPVQPPQESTPAPEPSVPGETWAPGPLTLASSAPIPAGDGSRRAGQAWPTAPGLPETRRIAQALRPMMRRSRSPWHHVLDEEATASRAAQDNLWLPEWRDAPWRRYEVALVVDTSSSMDIWQQTVREFRTLLTHQGAFRDTRTYLVDSSKPVLTDKPLRAEGATGRACHWKQLVDPNGRRIVMVLTDTIGRAWHSGALGNVLYQWGQSMPVAVVQTMAQRLWSWGGLTARRMRLSAPREGATNSQLRTSVSGPDPEANGGGPAIPVPVLGLSADWMSGWARLLSSPGPQWVETTATFVRPQSHPTPEPDGSAEEPLTAEKRVLRFRTMASVQAFQLAGLLAAAPLSLPLMKLVQRVLLPGSTVSELAEVILGGLLKKLPNGEAKSTRSTISYDFIDGVREELLASGQRADTARVARVLNEYAGAEIPALRNYSAAIEDPESTEDPETSPEDMPFLRVQAAVFRALSGPYHPRAKRLRRALGKEVDHAGSLAPSVGGDPTTDHATGRTTVTTSKSPADTAQPSARPEGDDVAATLSSGRPSDAVRTPQIWGTIPLRNPDFVGRKELLERLRQRLTEPGATAVLPEAVHGMGGVGKSQTVVEYIYRHASEYDVVWWIPAEHQTQIKASFVELAKRLGVPAAASADTAVPAVLEALRRGEPYTRWILVFDNADQPTDVRRFFPAGSGHIVVTSRNSEWGGSARPVEVDLFTRAESMELLQRRGGQLEDADADRLAAALGDLPLAIEQAAAWRAQTGMQVSEYLELLKQNRTELLEAGTTSDYQMPVAAAWNVPLNKLKNEHKAALQLLQMCAFFGPEPISRKMFIGVRDAPVPNALEDALRDPIKLNRAIREISRYSLAKIDHRSNTLQLHRLVQTVLKNRLPDLEQDEMRHAVHVLLVNGDPGDPNATDNWTRYGDLLPHALASKAVECNDPWVRQLIHNLVRYLHNRGDWSGARDLASQAVEALTKTIGAQHVDTLEMTRQYGIALRRLGQVEEAILLNQKTYKLMLEAVGDEHEMLLGMLDTVAADRRSQGRFAEELEMQQEVYDRSYRILGEDDPATLIYAHNLGGCLRLMGKFADALARDEKTLARRAKALGPEHLQTFGSRNAVAMDLRETGQYLEAARIQQETLKRQREIFGDNHPRILGAIRNLAVALQKGGRHDEARANAEECLTGYRSLYGDKNVDTATAQMNLSTIQRILGDLDKSQVNAEASYAVIQDLRGPQHPYSLIAATNLAVTYRILGEHRRAKELDELAYRQLRDVFDSDHPFTLVSATNLASDHAATGDFAAAKTLDEDTLARSTAKLGAEHPSTLAVALNLALDLADLGEESASALLHSKTVESFRKTLGASHPATVAASQRARANCDTDTMQL